MAFLPPSKLEVMNNNFFKLLSKDGYEIIKHLSSVLELRKYTQRAV